MLLVNQMRIPAKKNTFSCTNKILNGHNFFWKLFKNWLSTLQSTIHIYKWYECVLSMPHETL